jgi:GNAT superfamily N-acetyltransferase
MATLVSPAHEFSNQPEHLKDSTTVTSRPISDTEQCAVSPSTSPGLPDVYTIDDLSHNPTLLHEIVALVNDAYWVAEVDFAPSLRFPQDRDMIEQLGPALLCAVVRLDDRIVATASLMPFREARDSEADEKFKEMCPGDYALAETDSYEVKAVAVANDPGTRKRGLATMCIRALEDTIRALNQNRGRDTDFLFWLHTEEKANGAYWRRRRYRAVHIEWKPKGFWGALREFEYTTLVRKVSGTGATEPEYRVECQSPS